MSGFGRGEFCRQYSIYFNRLHSTHWVWAGIRNGWINEDWDR